MIFLLIIFFQTSEAAATDTEGGDGKDKNDETPEFVYKSLSFEEMAGVNFTTGFLFWHNNYLKAEQFYYLKWIFI